MSIEMSYWRQSFDNQCVEDEVKPPLVNPIAAMNDQVRQKLRIIYDRTVSSELKQQAQQELDAFSATSEGVAWALEMIGSTGIDSETQFYAATILERTVKDRWLQLNKAQQLEIEQRTWNSVFKPTQPSFITRKLASCLALMVCFDWQPSLWDAIQQSFNDPSSVETSLILVDSIMEHLHSVSQNNQIGLRGAVLSSQIPALAQRLQQARPTVLSLLYTTASSAQNTPSNRTFALKIFSKIISDVPGLDLSPIAPRLITAITGILAHSLAEKAVIQDEEGFIAAAQCLTNVLITLRGSNAVQQMVAQIHMELSPVYGWLVDAQQVYEEPPLEVHIAVIKLLATYLSVLLEGGQQNEDAVSLIIRLAEQRIINAQSPLQIVMTLEIFQVLLDHLNIGALCDFEDPDTAPYFDHRLPQFQTSAVAVMHFLLTTVVGNPYEGHSGMSIILMDVSAGSGHTMEESLGLLSTSHRDVVDDSSTTSTSMSRLMKIPAVDEDSELALYLNQCNTYFYNVIGIFQVGLVESSITHQLEHQLRLLGSICTDGVTSSSNMIYYCIRLYTVIGLGSRLLAVTYMSISPEPLVKFIRLLKDMVSTWLQVAPGAISRMGYNKSVSDGLVLVLCRAQLALAWALSQYLYHDLPSSGQHCQLVLVQGAITEEISEVVQIIQMALQQPVLEPWKAELTAAAGSRLKMLTSQSLGNTLNRPVELLSYILHSESFKSLHSIATHLLTSGSLGCDWRVEAASVCWAAVSDLALGCWHQKHLQEAEAIQQRSEHYKALMQPLLSSISQAVHSLAINPTSASAMATIRCVALSVTKIVTSFGPGVKCKREIICQSLLLPYIQQLIQVYPRSATMSAGTINATLVSLKTIFEMMMSQFDIDTITSLFSVLYSSFSNSSNSNSFDVELSLEELLKTALANGGGTQKYKDLVAPSLHFCIQCYDRADSAHDKAHFLIAVMTITSGQWRVAQHIDGAVNKLLDMICGYFSSCAQGIMIPVALDVKMVIEELFDLAVVVQLFSSNKPQFQGIRTSLSESLLTLLMSRICTGAQESMIGALYSLSAANWTEFMVGFVPSFATSRLSAGPSQSRFLELMGASELSANDFDRNLLCFLNDYWFYTSNSV